MRGLITLLFVGLAAAAIARPVAGGAMVCGGGEPGEREALARHARGANLALEFAGPPVDDVEVRLIPVGDDAHALSARADGPLCFVGVAPGLYRIEAMRGGARRSTLATIPATVDAPVRIDVGFNQ